MRTILVPFQLMCCNVVTGALWFPPVGYMSQGKYVSFLRDLAYHLAPSVRPVLPSGLAISKRCLKSTLEHTRCQLQRLTECKQKEGPKPPSLEALVRVSASVYASDAVTWCRCIPHFAHQCTVHPVHQQKLAAGACVSQRAQADAGLVLSSAGALYLARQACRVSP